MAVNQRPTWHKALSRASKVFALTSTDTTWTDEGVIAKAGTIGSFSQTLPISDDELTGKTVCDVTNKILDSLQSRCVADHPQGSVVAPLLESAYPQGHTSTPLRTLVERLNRTAFDLGDVASNCVVSVPKGLGIRGLEDEIRRLTKGHSEKITRLHERLVELGKLASFLKPSGTTQDMMVTRGLETTRDWNQARNTFVKVCYQCADLLLEIEEPLARYCRAGSVGSEWDRAIDHVRAKRHANE